MGDYFDRNGDIIDLQKWARYFEDLDYKTIARDELDDGKVVSTIWLGVDHSWGDSNTPVIFETMVFPSGDDFEDLYMSRYTSEEDAIAGHAEAIEVAKTL